MFNNIFKVRGSCKDDLHAVQVPERVTSLASNQAYVLETPGTTYLWIGKVIIFFNKKPSMTNGNLVV